MELIRDGTRIYTSEGLNSVLSEFGLEGRTVLCYSSLLNFGRIAGKDAVLSMIESLKNCIGSEGTLCLPCYTFSAYDNEIFDPQVSKSKTGVLGETARDLPGFVRTVHPVYSHVCRGRKAEEFRAKQDPSTCFGDNSFFELLCRPGDAYVLFLGTNLGAHTLYHHYEQRLQAAGRFIKHFKGTICEASRL